MIKQTISWCRLLSGVVYGDSLSIGPQRIDAQYLLDLGLTGRRIKIDLLS
jgi:hypothetical protein